MAFEVGRIHLFADVVTPIIVEDEMNISKIFIISICYKLIAMLKKEPLVLILSAWSGSEMALLLIVITLPHHNPLIYAVFS